MTIIRTIVAIVTLSSCTFGKFPRPAEAAAIPQCYAADVCAQPQATGFGWVGEVRSSVVR